MLYKFCERCKKRLVINELCDCKKVYSKARNRDYDSRKRDRNARAFYMSREWKLTRTRALELDGLDVWEYMTTGRRIAADTVHHIIPLLDDWDRRADIDNLMSLSHQNHSMLERMYKSNKQETIDVLKK